jgi:hypothetical protein
MTFSGAALRAAKSFGISQLTPRFSAVVKRTQFGNRLNGLFSVDDSPD